MQPVSGQRSGKHVPAETDTHATIEKQHFLRGPYRGIILKTTGATSSVMSRELTESSAREVVNIEPVHVKLKNLHC
jgi:hypothetical protein